MYFYTGILSLGTRNAPYFHKRQQFPSGMSTDLLMVQLSSVAFCFSAN